MKKFLAELKTILSILPKKMKKKMRVMLLMLSISGFLESLTIGLFIPLIAIFLEEKTSYTFLNKFYDYSKFDTENLITIIISLILSVYLLKSIFLTFLEFGMQKLINSIRVEIVSALFKKYVNSPYKFHLKNHSSILLRNLSSEVVGFTHGIIEPILMLAKEFFVIIFILSLLFLFDYKISIFAISFGILLVLSVKMILRKLLYTLSSKSMYYRGQVNKIILESLQGIKFIKSYKIESNFTGRLLGNLELAAKVKSKENAIVNMPRIWIELTVLILLAILGFCFLILGSSMSSYLSFISLFLIAMLKMLPSFLSAIRTINSYQSHKPSIDFIKNELSEKIEDYQEKNTEESNKKEVKLDKEFIIKDISFKYEGQKKNIIQSLNLEIKKKNELIGIFGDSGVGKTTLIDILIGLHNPQEGEFYIDGDIIKQKMLRGKIFGYVPQTIYLFDDTIKNNILITNNSKVTEEEYNNVLEQCNLSEYVNSLPDKDQTIIGENGAQISGGQKQRIGLARAIVNDAKILILDEATNALDKRTEENIFETLKKISSKKSIIIITHNRNLLNYCNKIYCLKNGKLNQEK